MASSSLHHHHNNPKDDDDSIPRIQDLISGKCTTSQIKRAIDFCKAQRFVFFCFRRIFFVFFLFFVQFDLLCSIWSAAPTGKKLYEWAVRSAVQTLKQKYAVPREKKQGCLEDMSRFADPRNGSLEPPYGGSIGPHCGPIMPTSWFCHDGDQAEKFKPKNMLLGPYNYLVE